MDWLTGLASAVWQSFTKVVRYPVDETQRVYIPYLIASLVIAMCVYAMVGRRTEDREQRGGMLVRLFRFLFPAEIWRHRSTWVDVKYFIPHQMVRIWIYTSLVTLISTVIMNWTFFRLEGLKRTPGAVFSIESQFGLAVLYTVVTIVVADFFAFLMHYLQHKVPILWQFHKVHHSAEVLNPLTNYREHPIDNISYAIVLAFATGVTAAVFWSLFWV
ncbi:MAG: sterol desaturase family protein, partial [Pirellulales bacterium]|nr:sterol desaturase family protein [Pirellulales bacterium]